MSIPVDVFTDSLRAEVGEGPHWDEPSQTLWQVDLTAGTVLCHDDQGCTLVAFSVGQEVGAVIPRTRGGVVLAVRDGIAVASNSGDAFETVIPIERDVAGNRMNDAKCDPAGRLFAGTTA